MDEIKLSREELYKLVWEEPITTVAKRLGLSDVGLAKICKRYNIPRTERGYWAKKASGKFVRRIPLPKISPEERYLDSIIIQLPTADAFRESEEISAVLAFEKDEANLVVVPETLSSPHRLIQHTKRSLKSGSVDEKGVLRTQDKGVLNIQVTKSSFDRALRIMNALVKAMERRGYELRPRHSSYYGNKHLLAVYVEGEEVLFGLDEKISRQDYTPTPTEQRKLDQRKIYPYQLPRHEYIATRKLTLRFWGWGSNTSRSTWSDAKIQRVENCLNDFLANLYTSAVEMRMDREKREREEQLRREERARKEELVRLRSEEQARVDNLKADASSWKEAQRIRSDIEAVRYSVSTGVSTILSGEGLQEWLSWAEQHADRLDPLIESPPSILDKPDE